MTSIAMHHVDWQFILFKCFFDHYDYQESLYFVNYHWTIFVMMNGIMSLISVVEREISPY
jgi:hypothetical protein